MDTKKLILAIVLSVTVLLVYQYFFMPKPVAQNRRSSPRRQQPKTPRPLRKPGAAAAPDIGSILNQPEAGPPRKPNCLCKPCPKTWPLKRKIRSPWTTLYFTAVFTNRGAGLTSFILKKYKDDAKKPMDLVSRSAKESSFYPFYFSFGKRRFFRNPEQGFVFIPRRSRGENRRLGANEIVFEYADPAQNLLARKKFIFTDNSYVIRLEFQVSKNGRMVDALPVVFGPDLENNDSRERTMMMNLKIAAYNGTTT